MNIQVYDWEIESIDPIVGENPDERRIKIYSRNGASVSLWLTPEQTTQLSKAISVLYPPTPKEVTL